MKGESTKSMISAKELRKAEKQKKDVKDQPSHSRTKR